MIDRIRQKMELIENINYLKEMLDEEHIKMAKNAGKSIKDLFNTIDRESLIKSATSKIHDHVIDSPAHIKDYDDDRLHHSKGVAENIYKHLKSAKSHAYEMPHNSRTSEILSKIGNRIEKLNKIRSLRGDH